MKKTISIVILIVSLMLFFSYQAKSQADEITKLCTQYLVPPFISDGQQYKALLNGDELAEFHSSFYGGSTYRIIACSGLSEGNLLFSLYDKERNLLFTNKNYENSPYWDFKFSSTIECILEAELDTKNSSSGFAILMIGFKQ
ncbi:MAG: hypothetical protein ABIJ97_02245 [Bacteroidota bacterium]